ncbi:MAG: hypothetical protein QOH24_1613 [Verrucomicrobiota bacterium]|jgi:putative membrane protein
MAKIPDQEEPDLLKGIVAGIAGGLFASFLMEQFQALWSGVAAKLTRSTDNQSNEAEEPATIRVANALALRVQGRELPKGSRPIAGEAVHYAMGAVSGAIYGGLVEIVPAVEFGDGLGFGTGLWLLADEVSVPALKLSKPPTDFPLSTHIYALASHLVYGWVTEQVRRAIRSSL